VVSKSQVLAVKEEKRSKKLNKDKPKESLPKEKLVAEYKKEEKKEVNPTDGTRKATGQSRR